MQDQTSRIFVFGSNLLGRHGKGAALRAKMRYGAEYGTPIGFVGQSYAIPTKDINLNSLPLDQIDEFVKQFLIFSTTHPELQFNVTQIGCGLAGYKPKDIAPLFNVPPSARTNLWFDHAWAEYLIPGPCNFFEGEL